MIIEIHQPEIEALIEQRMASGQFESIEDLLLQSLEATPVAQSPRHDEANLEKQNEKQNFADFLLNSPLHGSGLVVERIKDVPRIIEC